MSATARSVRHTWSESDRFVPRAVVQPVQRLLRHEAAGGVVMLVAAVVAVAWANSPWRDTYTDLWGTPLRLELGSLLHLDHLSLQHWVNDGLMTAFFLLVGLEIKREVVHGELGEVRAVAVPVVAALGGMVVPAAVFSLLNVGGPGAEGWGIPMATDIAFAVGVVSLLGARVPLAGKVFLLTLAVADDIGAIVVIAVFYTGSLSVGWLAVAAAAMAAVVAMQRNDVHALAPYLGAGALAWLALLESGVHATLAGVALGIITPAWPLRSPAGYADSVCALAARVEGSLDDGVLTDEELSADEHLVHEVLRLSRQTISPLERLERALTPWVAYLVVPVFALANAGVELSAETVGGLVSDRVTLGVVLGLVIGKTVGVLGGTVLAVRLGVGRLPMGTSWRQVLGLAMCAGVGFTVALFVTSISLEDAALAASAKVGILAGSLLAGVAGYLVLRAGSPTTPGTPERAAPAPPDLVLTGAPDTLGG